MTHYCVRCNESLDGVICEDVTEITVSDEGLMFIGDRKLKCIVCPTRPSAYLTTELFNLIHWKFNKDIGI